MLASFKRDFKRVVRGKYKDVVLKPGGELWEVVDALARDILLPEAYHDHPLRGERKGSRECHVCPDLLLVYENILMTIFLFSGN